MYEEFFRLHRKPFELVPTPDMLFMSRSHRKALSYLEYGFKERAGFILLTGEVGSGKTTIIKNLVRTLGKEVSRAMIFNTLVTAEQLLAMINEEFGLDPAGRDKVGLLGQLNTFLVDQYGQRRHTLVIIDEAQNLSPAALEEVRLLSNLETDQAKLLQIVLVGQPELKEIIAQPGLRQLRQRIGVSCHLAPLNREETEAYIHYRLEQAGRRDAVLFGAGVFDILHRCSGGIPRIINTFCDFILLTAFVEGTREVEAGLVQEVISDLSLDFPGSRGRAPAHAPGTAGTPASAPDAVTFLQDQVGKQTRVLKKVIRVQQSQVRQLEKQLENVDSRLNALCRDLARLVALLAPAAPGDGAVDGRVLPRDARAGRTVFRAAE